MATESKKMLPQDLNAEAAVISAMMIDNHTVARALEMLSDEHFYRTSHKILFRTIRELFEANIEIDIITLIDRLKQKKKLADVGGETFINELSDMVLSGANIEYHANIVLGKALLRQLINVSNKIIENCYNVNTETDRTSNKKETIHTVEDIVDDAEQSIFQIAERPSRKTFINLTEIIPRTLENIEKAAASGKAVIGITTGFPSLSRKLGGFRPGQLIIIASRPGMGKSSFALNIAFKLAMRDLKIAIFTMEMESEECLMRMLSSASEVSMEHMLRGYGMDQKKILNITRVADVLHQKQIYIDDSGSNTMLDIRAKARRLKAEIDGLDLILVDYMQLMNVKRNRENRQQEIAEISRSLKILAKELEVPIIALSQLNRAVESRVPPIPKLADLRESGAIEQDADIVMAIFRPIVYKDILQNKWKDRDGNEISIPEEFSLISILKNRHGSIGDVELLFRDTITQFRDPEDM